MKRSVGKLTSIELDTNLYGFGCIREEPLVSFFDLFKTTPIISMQELDSIEPSFSIWVMNYALRKKSWQTLDIELSPEHFLLPKFFFIKDALSGELYKTIDGSQQIETTIDECRELERAAVWDPEHVEERLFDLYKRRPNKWVELYKI